MTFWIVIPWKTNVKENVKAHLSFNKYVSNFIFNCIYDFSRKCYENSHEDRLS